MSYTEFTTQVEQRNVAEVFSRGDTIEGKLRQPRPLPGQDAGGQNVRTYQKFTTERPTFAQDDLLTALKNSGATVSATPLTQQRGILANLLISVAPTLLLFVFWYWLFKRSEKLGMGMFGGFWKKHKPVDPESVRVTFDDVAGIDEVKAEINEVVDYLRDPEKYRKLGARVPKGVLLAGAPAPGRHCWPGYRGRGERAVLFGEWLGVYRDDRWGRCLPGARVVRRGAQGCPVDHLHR
ncbi:ATP-dependent zinc metalloprotease FtsH domain protein [Mycobacterium xenopi 3993]|nr:ATP-dependent zinc metalloprotease FtsH domain protein [Mycobacterium xenopi 3993]